MSDPRMDVRRQPGPRWVLPKGLRRVPEGLDELATEHLILNMGPQHPSTHGVLHVLLELDGEEVQAAEASVGYLHRGIEKLAESRKYHQVGTLLDRSDYLAGLHTETAFALAVERLAGIEVPRKADWIRSLTMELCRIASHVVWAGTFGMDAGAMAPFLYIMRDREAILDILEAITGGRMMFNYVRPGGVFADLPAGVDTKIRAFLDTFDTYLERDRRPSRRQRDLPGAHQGCRRHRARDRDGVRACRRHDARVGHRLRRAPRHALRGVL